MTHTILFFGDSITRGHGVGREGRFAALVADEIRTRSADPWEFSVAATLSDFAAYRKRLNIELGRVRPDVLVCQCPGGPACYFPRFPAWVRAVLAVERWFFGWLTERYVSTELERDAARTRHESLYESHWVTRLHRWRPSNWPLIGPLWRARARRYPTIPKVSLEGYVGRMLRLRDAARERGVRRVLFISPIPFAEDICPGYLTRMASWCVALRAALDEPQDGSRFVDVFTPLQEAGLGRILLNDGLHLTVEGHRLAAAVVAPALELLLVD